MLQGKYSPYPGDVIEARLEPGEFVVNRNAVNAIGKDNLEAMNDDNPRYAQEGGLQEQNALKLRRAKEMNFFPTGMAKTISGTDTIGLEEKFGSKAVQGLNPAMKQPKFRKRVDPHQFDLQTIEPVVQPPDPSLADPNLPKAEWSDDAPNLSGTVYNPILMPPVNVNEKSPQTIAREKADLLLHNERMLKFGAYNKVFKLKAPQPPPPPPPPSALGDVTTPFSQQLKSKYLDTMPINEGVLLEGYEKMKGSGRGLAQETPTEKKKRWALRRRMIFDSKSQPHPNDMLTVEDMAGRESGTEAQQLGFLLDNYRVKETGLTFDDFRMDHPVAYETLKKNYSRAFYDMQGEYEVMEIEEQERALSEAEDKKLMAPHKAAIANRLAQLHEEDDEARHWREVQEEEDRVYKMQEVANFGLPGWEKSYPRIIASDLIDNYSMNNQVADGSFPEGTEITGANLTSKSEEYMGWTMLNWNATGTGANINLRNPDSIKEKAQNLRHLYNIVAEERGLHSKENTAGITTEQLSQTMAMIDDAENFAMQGYSSVAGAEEKRLEIEMQQQARQNAIDNMEEKKDPLSKKLKDFAGSLLFGQTGGYVQAYQEGGSVSLNNSRRLFNIARRKYA